MGGVRERERERRGRSEVKRGVGAVKNSASPKLRSIPMKHPPEKKFCVFTPESLLRVLSKLSGPAMRRKALK